MLHVGPDGDCVPLGVQEEAEALGFCFHTSVQLWTCLTM